MKKFFSVLVVATIILFTVNCGGGSSSSSIGGKNSPASIEKEIYNQMKKGNYEKVFDHIAGFDSDEISATDRREIVKALSEKAKQSADAQGGLKDFEILSETISDDGLTATVETKLVFGNGSEETQTSKYVKTDDKWQLAMDK
ncbi:MAG: DUF4878 domain-containing protein [Dysgonamonadaceae bacterium]|jgi:hypothetical protein|nr:DUF4878 domain-containing protein [Dysgonamonadaceae bacterium]